jgi:Arm DNA-binding domain
MPTKPEGVYQDGRGGWYLKVNVGRDPLTGRREQITKRSFRTAAEAGRERRELLTKIDSGQLSPTPAPLTVNELLPVASTTLSPLRHACLVHQGAQTSEAHSPRPPAHERNPHVGQRRTPEGCGRTARSFRPHAVCQSLQSRHADHAA